MVLDIIGAAVLIAFGFIAVFFSVNEAGDEKFLLILLIGILAVFAGGWILISKLTLAVILQKTAGLILAGIGLFMVIGFPDVSEHQRKEMSFAGVLIGLIMLIAGAYLLIF